ncbi:MAG: uroporphyrinogen-III synthase [Thiohalobacterales bacterium]|nr:uroporphyrinogen-III synthase [Thiohalobacterales bacterium]
MSTADSLRGLRVLVTRPAGQADHLHDLIAAAGGRPVRLPAIEIHDTTDVQGLQQTLMQLERYDLAVFISVNAVEKTMEYCRFLAQWPDRVKIATVGARSAEALESYGLSVDLVPVHRFNSEALLALPELRDMSGRRVVIFRGNGGRDMLRNTLVQRGAEVDYVEVYRRVCPDVDPGSLQHLWQPGVLDVITVTSNETLQNLFDMAGSEGQAALCDIPLVVASQRQVALAQQLGFTREPLVAENAGDEAIVNALARYLAHRDAGAPD